MPGPMWMRPASEAAASVALEFFSAVKLGSASSAIFNLAAVPLARKLRILTTKLGGRWTGSSRPRSVRLRIGAGDDGFGGNFFAASEDGRR